LRTARRVRNRDSATRAHLVAKLPDSADNPVYQAVRRALVPVAASDARPPGPRPAALARARAVLVQAIAVGLARLYQRPRRRRLPRSPCGNRLRSPLFLSHLSRRNPINRRRPRHLLRRLLHLRLLRLRLLNRLLSRILRRLRPLNHLLLRHHLSARRQFRWRLIGHDGNAIRLYRQRYVAFAAIATAHATGAKMIGTRVFRAVFANLR
jgi:hypothetical protein